MKFTAVAQEIGGKLTIVLPFDPNAVWRPKAKHHTRGTINGCEFRAPIENGGITFGPAWRRDNGINAGESVEVIIEPEGHLTDNVAPDLAEALNADDKVRNFFDSLPSFYRNNYVRDIESAKKPETRIRKIAKMIDALTRGERSP